MTDGGQTALWSLVQEWLDEGGPGVNQALLAREVGVSRQAVTLWRQGATVLPPDRLGKVAATIGRPYALVLTAVLRDGGYLGDAERVTTDMVGNGPGEPHDASSGRSTALWEVVEIWAGTHSVPPKVTNVAERVGISDKVLGKWLTQRVMPKPVTLRKFADGLEVSFDRVLLAILQDNGYVELVEGPRVPAAVVDAYSESRTQIWDLLGAHVSSFKFAPSAEALARELGTTESAIVYWSQGRMPTPAEVRSIAAFVGLPYRSVLMLAMRDGGYLRPDERL